MNRASFFPKLFNLSVSIVTARTSTYFTCYYNTSPLLQACKMLSCFGRVRVKLLPIPTLDVTDKEPL